MNPIPEGAHTLTPNLILRDCFRAIEFYKQALGAVEMARMMSPDGRSVWHAELRVGNSTVYVNDEMPGMTAPAPSARQPVPVTMWLWVPDCDAAFQRAVGAGAKPTMPPADMFWGDRCARVDDGFGYAWSFSTRQKEITVEEMRRAGEEFARTMGDGAPQQAH
ncbi:MAG TPA: VOC family protein [Anaeromyxobacter sp.]|nr:VOC family protein [Anaeromyxobacter sp.]